MTATRIDAAKRLPAVVAGLVAGASALGAGELVAGLREDWQSPVVGVAEAVIERVPRSVKDFGVERFGTNDKLALIIGILVFSVIFAAVLGLVGRRRFVAGAAGFVAFALVGVWGSQQPVAAPFSAVLPSLLAGAAGVVVLRFLLDRAAARTATDESNGMFAMPERRQFLFSTAGLVVMAGAAAAGGRALRTRFSAASSRKAVVLPAAGEALPPAAAGVSSTTPGVSSFFTPNADFYRIDTALDVPQIRTEEWSARASHGMVDNQLRSTYADLLAAASSRRTSRSPASPTTGRRQPHRQRPLVGSAHSTICSTRQVSTGADQLVGRSVDGYTCGFPVGAIDGRPALVAIGMNGEPLPLEHGYPARLIVPGLYGYVSATKWLTELELTTFDAFDQYWVRRGLGPRRPDQDHVPDRHAQGPRPRSQPGTVRDRRRGLGPDDRHLQGRGPDRRRRVHRGHPGRRAERQHVATVVPGMADATPGRHRLTVLGATDARRATPDRRRADRSPTAPPDWMSIFVDVADADGAPTRRSLSSWPIGAYPGNPRAHVNRTPHESTTPKMRSLSSREAFPVRRHRPATLSLTAATADSTPTLGRHIGTGCSGDAPSRPPCIDARRPSALRPRARPPSAMDSSRSATPTPRRCRSGRSPEEGTLEGMTDDPVATAASQQPGADHARRRRHGRRPVDTLNSAEALTVFAPDRLRVRRSSTRPR